MHFHVLMEGRHTISPSSLDHEYVAHKRARILSKKIWVKGKSVRGVWEKGVVRTRDSGFRPGTYRLGVYLLSNRPKAILDSLKSSKTLVMIGKICAAVFL